MNISLPGPPKTGGLKRNSNPGRACEGCTRPLENINIQAFYRFSKNKTVSVGCPKVFVRGSAHLTQGNPTSKVRIFDGRAAPGPIVPRPRRPHALLRRVFGACRLHPAPRIPRLSVAAAAVSES